MSVEDRLRILEDKEAIRDILIAYGRTLDSRDTKGYSELFAADGEWSGGIGQSKTPAGIKKMLDDLFAGAKPRAEGDLPKAHHVMSNMVIDLDGDTATATSRWMWVTKSPDAGPIIMRAGRYDDQFIRENGAWKIRKRQAVTEVDTPPAT